MEVMSSLPQTQILDGRRRLMLRLDGTRKKVLCSQKGNMLLQTCQEKSFIWGRKKRRNLKFNVYQRVKFFGLST